MVCNMDAKKRVIFIPYTLSQGGGAERVLAEYLENIDKTKYEIDILECHRGINTKYLTIKGVNYLPPIYDENRSGLTNSLRKHLLRYSSYCGFLSKILTPKKKYDVCVSFNYQIPSFINRYVRCRHRIMWVHGSIEDLDYKGIKGFRKFLRFLRNRLQLKAFEKADDIITISDMSRNSIVNLFSSVKNKIGIIHNGFDLEKITLNSEEPTEIDEKQRHRLIVVSRLDSNKNVISTIRALALIRKRVDAELFILGDGPERASLEAESRRLGLEDFVKFFGFIDNPYPYIKTADLLCLSSYTEGSPVIVLESLRLGVPFVSYEVGGVEEFSENGTVGKVVRNRNFDNYVSMVVNLLDSDEVLPEMKRKAPLVAARYDIRNQVILLENLLNK